MGSRAFSTIVHGEVRENVSASPVFLVTESLILKPSCFASTLACAISVSNGTSFQPFLVEIETLDTMTSPVDPLMISAVPT